VAFPLRRDFRGGPASNDGIGNPSPFHNLPLVAPHRRDAQDRRSVPREGAHRAAASVCHARRGDHSILQVYIRESVYSAAVNDMYGCEKSAAQVLPRFAILDPLLEQLCIAIARALRDGTVEDGLYTDTLAQMIAVHLARYHCSRSHPLHMTTTKPIPSWKIRRLVDFIEENLDRDLSLGAMAAEVAVSPLYLPRSFKAAVGQSPHQYVIGRRIERAKELLSSGDSPIVDVALAVGFSSQSHLSSWFLRLVGVSPAEYRRQSAG